MRARLWSLVLLAVAALSGETRAQGPAEALAREAAGLELKFVVKKDRLQVSDGSRSADLGITATHVLGSSRSKDRTS
jgi:hypothetical protein